MNLSLTTIVLIVIYSMGILVSLVNAVSLRKQFPEIYTASWHMEIFHACIWGIHFIVGVLGSLKASYDQAYQEAVKKIKENKRNRIGK